MKRFKVLFIWLVAAAFTALSSQCVCAQSAPCETVQKVSQAPKCHGGTSAPAEKEHQAGECCGNCVKGHAAVAPASAKPDLTAKHALPVVGAVLAESAGSALWEPTQFFDTSGPPLRPSLFQGHLYAPRAPPIAR